MFDAITYSLVDSNVYVSVRILSVWGAVFPQQKHIKESKKKQTLIKHISNSNESYKL